MNEIIDLDLLVSETIKFKINEKIYEIPTSYKTETVIRIMHIEQEMKKLKDTEKILNLQDKCIYILFSQLNEIDEEWVKQLHHTQKIAILNHYKSRMEEVNSNPNSGSLPSQK